MAREIDTAAEAAATAALPRCHEVHCNPDGARTQLIQHVSQLNVMLKAWPKDPGAGRTQTHRIPSARRSRPVRDCARLTS